MKTLHDLPLHSRNLVHRLFSTIAAVRMLHGDETADKLAADIGARIASKTHDAVMPEPKPVRTPKAAPAPTKRRKRVSAKTRATRVVQGRYLGFIRQIPVSQRPKYQKIAKEVSREAAIAAMREKLNK